jgi:hypothetical protein
MATDVRNHSRAAYGLEREVFLVRKTIQNLQFLRHALGNAHGNLFLVAKRENDMALPRKLIAAKLNITPRDTQPRMTGAKQENHG